MDMSSVMLILALPQKWRVPAKHGDIPNAYVRAEKGSDLSIYLHISKGMDIGKDVIAQLETNRVSELALALKKALFGLKQAGRLWSEWLHKKLKSLGFSQCLTDICVYRKHVERDIIVVDVYVDDLLVTATKSSLVNTFFDQLQDLSVKNLGKVQKFLGMRINYT